MYVAALSQAATDAATAAVPYVHMSVLFELGPLPIQAFGVIVAAGVLIGAMLLRRYAEWHGVSDDHIRGLLGWITVTGFLGAHIFDVVAYQQHKPWFDFNGIRPGEWPLMLQLWNGISSYGGFVGGAMGFAFYVWWKKLPVRLMADVSIVGLLPAFSIGRIGCTVVSDHIGKAMDPDAWYRFLAMDYPRTATVLSLGKDAAGKPIPNPDYHAGVAELFAENPMFKGDVLPAWNLGMIELLYLIPVNALILWLAFRRKRIPAGLVVALTGVLYAPVRFFMDYLRPESSDPRLLDLFTFAQWTSLVAFGAAAYVSYLVFQNGKPAEVIAPTSKEAQQMLTMELKKADEEAEGKPKEKKKDLPKATASDKKSEKKQDIDDPKLTEERRKQKELEDARAEERRKKEDEEERAADERRKKRDAEMAAKEEAKKKAAPEKPDQKDDKK